MSLTSTQRWLLANNRFADLARSNCKAQTISITSGKGGVGKTSVAIKMAQMLVRHGHKVLLIDCDYNLSNTVVKLGLPISNTFYSLVTAQSEFSDCLYRDGNFHLLAGCNGNLDLFDNGLELDRLIIDIIAEHEADYDYILLDCPAGISKATLTLNAYSDYRFVVVTPDKSSITDSYSLIKILNTKYGINTNHLLINKVSSDRQYQRIVKTLSETIEHFLGCQIKVLGGVGKSDKAVDLFDMELNDDKSEIHRDFIKVIKRFSEESRAVSVSPEIPYACVDDFEQDVQLTVC